MSVVSPARALLKKLEMSGEVELLHVTWPSYPPKLHEPKNENHGRITRGGKTTKSPSNSHVVERAVRIGERQRSRKPGKKKAYSERAAPTSPAPEGEGEAEARPRAPDNSPEAPPPLPLDQNRAGGEEAPLDNTPGAP